ncbi:MAG TPA: NAD(+) diphosphatase, partial [Caulobacteraceae bacterium]
MALDSFTNVFAGNPLDRSSYRRGDEPWLAARLADPETLAVAMWNGKPLVEDAKGAKDGGSAQIAYLAAGMAKAHAGGGERLLFLGLWKETAIFAVDIESDTDPADGPLAGLGRFEDLRAIATLLPASEAAIAATAKSMFEWRRRHRYCASCGEPSEPAEGGWKRLCRACGAQHFPRTDPVVIMLPVQGERCLLARQGAWPKGMYSALAGFLEPGESIEEACARELFEEAAVRATSVRYHSTQPWPYPSSLMIGLIAEIEPGEPVADNIEIDEVRWF